MVGWEERNLCTQSLPLTIKQRKTEEQMFQRVLLRNARSIAVVTCLVVFALILLCPTYMKPSVAAGTGDCVSQSTGVVASFTTTSTLPDADGKVSSR